MGGALAGKRAAITGAGSGIGRATALRFAAEGAGLLLVDVDADGLAATAAAAADRGAAVQLAVADVTDEAAVAAAFAGYRASGPIDVVVANAAVQLFGRDAAAADLELETWRTTLDVNLTGAFLTCKHGIRAMLADGVAGSVVCTASPTGMLGSAPGFDAYSTSKAGVVGLVRVLAADYGPHGIRVNAVVPGFTETPLVTAVMEDDAARRRLLEGIPLGRPGTAEEVAAAMLFLASDESSYATASVLVVDGGATGT
ncbi:MAG TPA: SDR family NAD(P)-dependent oxidoreductase [Baekduia sp.]|uniref:SDR family NAD(P)-dependent oxidoreductase n=1 Tax=Baekduia sp. TaxID=2600305 RepID=UPI002D79FA38|nr:SDR family NAD(P)-dependent oxidoreductase [Baekduia sp.]HET6507860.1 SDR family NAD(P)-dependent oxidoreductase [Baekduia sp.]